MSLTIHSKPLVDEVVLYTSGRHPKAEFYAMVPPSLTRLAHETIYFLAEQAAENSNYTLNNGDCIELGDVIVGITHPDERPVEMTRCNQDAKCIRLLFMAQVPRSPTPPTPILEPPQLEECPVCYERKVCGSDCWPRHAFTKESPGQMLWCTNGHSICVDCVRQCKLRRVSGALRFSCPVCRHSSPLSPIEVDVLIAGSWYSALSLTRSL